jgi:hypothetical protein
MASDSVFKKVLEHPAFTSALQNTVQTAVSAALSAKGVFEKNLRTALSAMNLPSTQDLESLQAKVTELETLLGQIDAKVELLLARAEPAEPAEPAKKPRKQTQPKS